MKQRIAVAGFAVACAFVAACSGPIVARPGMRTPTKSKTPPPGNNWPMPPAEAERLLGTAPFLVRELEKTDQGVAGAMKGAVTFPGRRGAVEVKWKPLPPGKPDGWNNAPRKEVAAYEIQKWFLQSADYVVPTTVVRCIPIAEYRRFAPEAKPTIDGTRCVLGMLSLWMEHVTVPKEVLDPARFARDPHYAYHLSNFNVLAFLVEHRDGRPGNILVADDETNRRVFAVDNGISFGGLVYNFLTTNWDVIRVPGIRRAVAMKLRAVGPEELGALATLVELRVDAKGILQPAALQLPLDPKEGVRIARGRVQMGLTTDEIDAVSKRLATLLHEVGDGTLKVF